MANKPLIIDAGYFFALFNKKDQHHKKAKALRSKIEERLWVTTWPVLTETCHLLTHRFGSEWASSFIHVCAASNMNIFELNEKHLLRIEVLLTKYRALPMDLADASLLILAEELGSGDIVSTDKRDFETYRWKNHHPFHNLFL